jgi:catechol 2,3-dioxygenase-like lactoylglutathione lyase family enzyme
MLTSGINHVSINAKNLEESTQFYVDLLDAVLLDTPNFGVPVQWLGLGAQQLHLFVREGEPATFQHFALTVEDLEPVYKRAQAMGAFDYAHKHHIIELPGDVAQTYVRDPAGNLLEIDTPRASRLPDWIRAEMRWLGDLFPQSEQNLRGRLYVGDTSG